MRLATKDFITHLAGFLKVRERLDNVAETVLPEDLPSQYEPVGLDQKPLQDKRLLEKIDDPSSASIEDRLADMLDIAGNEIKPLLDQFGKALVDKLKKEQAASSGDDSQQQYPKYKSAPLKSQKRSAEKVRNEYDGVALRIVDLVRASIVVNTEQQLATLLHTIFNTSENENFAHIQVVRFKNRFKYPTFSGYRDALFNLHVTSKSGHTMIVELQIHLSQVMEHKPESHFYYGYFRKFFLGNMDVVSARMELLTSLGSYVKNIKLDIHPHSASYDQKLDIDSILSGLEVKDHPDEIDPNRFDEEFNNPENEALQALIGKLVPFWELQDATDGASPSFSEIDESEDIENELEDETTKNKDGESVFTIDEVFEVAEGLTADLDALAEKLINNVAVYVDTDQRVCEWSDNPTTEREEEDGSGAVDSFTYDGTTIVSREYAGSLASDFKAEISEIPGLLNASITVSDEWYIWYLFEFMRTMDEEGHIELGRFDNEFQKEKHDGWYQFFAYRKSEYTFRLTGANGSMMVILRINHALLKPFEKDWLYYENDFFARYLAHEDWDVVLNRIALLDSLEVLVKEKMIKNFVGQLEDMIESLIENRDVENLTTFEALLGPKMLSDMSVAILCSRAKIRALTLKMEDGESVPEEDLLAARMSLGESLLLAFFYGDKLDSLEASEILEAVYEDMKLFYKDEKHPKVLRAAMQYRSAQIRATDEVLADVSSFKTVLDNFTEVFGEDDEATIECMLVYGQILQENEHDEHIEVFKTVYDKAVSALGESHFVTLNCGLDLAIAKESAGDANSDEYVEFVEKLYKTFVVVLGRTRPLLDLEETLVDSYKRLLDESSDTLTGTEYDRIEREIARIGALNAQGFQTGALVWSLDGMWYRFTQWDEVPTDAMPAVSTLGWEVDPNSYPWYPVDTRTWDELSPVERQAARVLGFNSYSWHDVFSGYKYITSNLSELAEEQRTASERLGWNEEKWGIPKLVEQEQRMWADLTREEKHAARELGFGLRSWNLLFAGEEFAPVEDEDEEDDGGDDEDVDEEDIDGENDENEVEEEHYNEEDGNEDM